MILFISDSSSELCHRWTLNSPKHLARTGVHVLPEFYEHLAAERGSS